MRTAPLFLAPLFLALASASAVAETPRDILSRYEKEAGGAGVPARGAQLYATRQGGEWSCATCHTEKPTQAGRHAKTDKAIAPLAPSANAERFTDPAKADKWFRRNCNDVANRQCTAQEKADLLAWLIGQKG